MPAEIETGDAVYLRSGSQKMTVENELEDGLVSVV